MGLFKRLMPKQNDIEDFPVLEVNDLIVASDNQLIEEDSEPKKIRKVIDIDDFWNDFCIW